MLLVKGSLACKTSALRTFNSCSTTTHHTPLVKPPLIIHHSSYTTHHTPLIIHHSSNHHSSNHHSSNHHSSNHHSSYTTHHTPLIKPPLIKPPLIKPPLIIHHSSYTTHQISWQVQQFVNLHVQISWQVQHFVNLQVQISWQVQYKMRFREIADARKAVFFNRTGGFEPGKSSSAERRLRDGLGSWSVGRPL